MNIIKLLRHFFRKRKFKYMLPKKRERMKEKKRKETLALD